MDFAPAETAEPTAPAEAARAPATAARRTCRCGFDRDHTMVSPAADYSFIGWVAILTGISWEPKAVTFTCRRCDQVLETVSDPVEMKKVRLFG